VDPVLEGVRGEYADELERLGAEMVAPLKDGERAIGLLVLGAMDDGAYPDAVALRAFDGIAESLGRILPGIWAVRELEKFSDALQERLNESTETGEKLASELEGAERNLEEASALLMRTTREGERERFRWESTRYGLIDLGQRSLREALFARAVEEGSKLSRRAGKGFRAIEKFLADLSSRPIRKPKGLEAVCALAASHARTLSTIDTILGEAGASAPLDLLGAVGWAFERYAGLTEGRVAVRTKLGSVPTINCDGEAIAFSILALLTDGGREVLRFKEVAAAASWESAAAPPRLRLDIRARPRHPAGDRERKVDLGFDLCCDTMKNLGGNCLQEGGPGEERLWIVEIPVVRRA
ncbi:MAG: hypothetical protein ACRD1Z_04505, partial [Vicinamibacteria bacterium]